jgi:hypothetical protein
MSLPDVGVRSLVIVHCQNLAIHGDIERGSENPRTYATLLQHEQEYSLWGVSGWESLD